MTNGKILDLEGDVLAVGDSQTGTDPREILRHKVAVSITDVAKRPTFRRADLRGFDFTGRSIDAAGDGTSPLRSCFAGASFAGSKLVSASLVGLDLRGADFTRCDMRGIYILACDLSGAIFDDADLSSDKQHSGGERRTWIRNCVFDLVQARNAKFSRASALHSKSAVGATFVGCDFHQAAFYGDWDNSVFETCTLEWATVGRPQVAAWPDDDRFGLRVTPDCNMRSLSMAGALSRPTLLPASYSVEPYLAPDEERRRWFSELPVVDYFDNLGALDRARPYHDTAGKTEVREEFEAAWKARWSFEYQSLPAPDSRTTARLELVTPDDETDEIVRVRALFSKPLALGYSAIRDQGFAVQGGAVVGARRVDGRSDLWELVVKRGFHSVTVTTLDALVDPDTGSPVSTASVTIPGKSRPVAATTAVEPQPPAPAGMKWQRKGSLLHPDRQFIPGATVNIWVRDNGTGLLRVMAASSLEGQMVDLGVGPPFRLVKRRRGLYVANLSISAVKKLAKTWP